MFRYIQEVKQIEAQTLVDLAEKDAIIKIEKVLILILCIVNS